MRLQLLQQVVHRQRRVAVVEPDDHPDRDHAPRPSGRRTTRRTRGTSPPAEAATPSCGSPRRNGRATFQTSFTPSAHVCGLDPPSSNRDERGRRQMPRRALRQDRHLRADVRPGLEPRQLLPRAPAPLVARPNPDHLVVRRREASPPSSPAAPPRRAPRPSPRATARAARATRSRCRGFASSAGSAAARSAPTSGTEPTRPGPRRRRGTASETSRRNGSGSITAPDRRCEPGALPFSSTATGTSPSRSASSGRAATSCAARIAAAIPAGPPPTTRIPTSIGSASEGSAIASASDHGGGKSAGLIRLGVGARAPSAAARSRSGRRRRRGRRSRRSARSDPC